ncbi:hypothetical protein C9374_001646 [Naegleria lovaniensis]|uniref:Uncharacterized protein n=1 Tax=Naegleria lovaniensis TaxID=51637 RepID=A0AA88GWC5_NAELO|nr:uncharacterized protein C9374_001646 [Naegleria lovaniensis]KAG2387314.1 hypothetical protein C9374_001646 [Naegleria lovaniensis]
MINPHYKPLLDQINELENSRRLQECKLVEERTRHAKTLKDLEELNLKLEKMFSSEALLKEKITHLESETRNESKIHEQLKNSVKYCKQEEEVFEKHVASYRTTVELKITELKAQLDEAEKNYTKALEMWNCCPNLKGVESLKKQVEELEAKLRHDESQLEEKAQRNTSIEHEIRMLKEQHSEMVHLSASLLNTIEKTKHDLQELSIKMSQQPPHNKSVIDTSKAESMISEFQKEIKTLQNELTAFESFNNDLRQDIENQERLQEALHQMIGNKLCMNCLADALHLPQQ